MTKKINIPNFLDKLAQEKRDFYVIEGKGIVNSLLLKAQKEYGFKKLSKKLNISDRSLYYYLSKQKKPSIRLIKNLCILTKQEEQYKNIYKNIQYISTSGHSEDKALTVFTKELAYLTGVIAGDGHITKRTQINIVTDSPKYLSFLINLNKKLFDISPKVYQDENGLFRLDINSHPLYFIFTRIIGLPKGKKKGVLKIPEFIYLNDSFKIYFLRGLFDTDGGLTLSKKGAKSILFSSSTLPFLNKVQELFKEFDVNFGGPYQSGNKRGYEIRSFKPEVMKKYKENIGSFHPEKRKKLSALVA